jgi:hypothetical protein
MLTGKLLSPIKDNVNMTIDIGPGLSTNANDVGVII